MWLFIHKAQIPGDILSDLEFMLGKCLEHLSKTSGYNSGQLKGTFMRKKKKKNFLRRYFSVRNPLDSYFACDTCCCFAD